MAMILASQQTNMLHLRLKDVYPHTTLTLVSAPKKWRKYTKFEFNINDIIVST